MLGHLLYSKQLGLDPKWPEATRQADRSGLHAAEAGWVSRMASRMLGTAAGRQAQGRSTGGSTGA